MSRKKREIVEPEWSHMVEVDKISTSPKKIAVSPNAEQRKRLAGRLGVISVEDVKGDLVLSRDTGNMVIFVSGQVYAKVTQLSAVSGQPMKTEVTDSVEAWYADPDQAVSFAKAKQEQQLREGAGEMPVLDEKEDPEAVIDGKIDVGELVVQYLSLAIDPYARKEGESFEVGDDQLPKPAADGYENPFAALKNWKKKPEKGS